MNKYHFQHWANNPYSTFQAPYNSSFHFLILISLHELIIMIHQNHNIYIIYLLSLYLLVLYLNGLYLNCIKICIHVIVGKINRIFIFMSMKRFYVIIEIFINYLINSIIEICINCFMIIFDVFRSLLYQDIKVNVRLFLTILRSIILLQGQ